jgi:hypothetical protein
MPVRTAACAISNAGPRRGSLRPIELAFAGDVLVFLAGTLDAILELAPIVGELLGHFIGSARRA